MLAKFKLSGQAQTVTVVNEIPSPVAAGSWGEVDSDPLPSPPSDAIKLDDDEFGGF